MQRTHEDSSRWRRRAVAAIAALLLAGPGLTACGPDHTVESIQAQQAAGDFEGTIEPLRTLLDERPDDTEIIFLYGRALAATERRNLATWPLRQAMEDPEWTVRAGLELAASALASADYNVVVETTTTVLELDPENRAALQLRARAHAHWRREPELAIADAERLLELDPDDIQAYEPKIIALLSLERGEEAGAEIDELGRRLEEIDSDERTRAWYCGTKAIFNEESGEVDEARELWKECLAEHPASSEVVWPAVEFYEGQGEPEAAIEVLRAALGEAPQVSAYRTLLADRLRQAGRPDEGEALLREATEDSDPRRAANAWLELARYWKLQTDYAKASEAFERAAEVARSFGSVPPAQSLELADAYVMAGRLDDALALTNGFEIPAHRHMIRGRVFQEKGMPARALEEFDEGMRLWPDNPWVRYMAGRAAEDLGLFDRALAEYRSSVRIDAAATNARTRIGQIMLASGEGREALQTVRTVGGSPLDPQGMLLALDLRARFWKDSEFDSALETFVETSPLLAGMGLARAAEGRAARVVGGPAAGLELLRSDHGLDLTDVVNGAALRKLVELAHRAGEPLPPPEVEAAHAKYPEIGHFHALLGRSHELDGDLERAQRAFERGLELDPLSPDALAGLGRLAAARGEHEAAIGLYDRAVEADPFEPDYGMLAVESLVALERFDDAKQRLDQLLIDHPTHARAAIRRAELDLDQGEATHATLERARRAVRFAGGVPALQLLARVHEQRGEAELAERALARAEAITRGESDAAESDPASAEAASEAAASDPTPGG